MRYCRWIGGPMRERAREVANCEEDGRRWYGVVGRDDVSGLSMVGTPTSFSWGRHPRVFFCTR